MIPKIPGWESVGNKRLSDTENPCAQIVGGQWYRPLAGCDTLQNLVDEWLEYVAMIWRETSYISNGVRKNMCTRTSEDAEDVLREWGMLDDKGEVIQKGDGEQ